MRRTVRILIFFFGIPLTYLSALWLRFVRKKGMGPKEDKIFMKLGILPILDYYYEPMINPKKHLKKSLTEDRILPGINFNVEEQLNLLSKFHYNEELLKFPVTRNNKREYYYNNNLYEAGDAEYLYNIIRHFKPKRIIEIGSGLSTLMARNALVQNQSDDKSYTCKHICIEPYENSWLLGTGVELIKERVEDLNKTIFQQLDANDILFIDSSHIIRAQGDVLFEYLEVLPILNSGVLVHIHDIFTPKDYPENWVYSHNLWNEQYLLEAFLTFNNQYRIIGALHYLTHHFHAELGAKCPVFAKQKGREAGAFWMIKN